MAKKHMTGLRSWFGARLRDRKGVAAVEFAFVLPLLITLYLGVVETTYSVMAERRVASVSSTVADLVAQTKTVNTTELDDIFRAATAIMVPFDSADLSVVITSVVIDKDGNATVDWSAVNPGSTAQPYANGASFDLPDGLKIPYTSLIVAEVDYIYNSFLNHVVTSGIPMSDTFYLRPRLSDTVKIQ
jgi:Flp pilus assembly protein TadG